MIHLAFAATVVALWVAITWGVDLIAGVWFPPAPTESDDDFDMTVEMSRSRRLGCGLILTGFAAVAIAFAIFAYSGWV